MKVSWPKLLPDTGVAVQNRRIDRLLVSLDIRLTLWRTDSVLIQVSRIRKLLTESDEPFDWLGSVLRASLPRARLGKTASAEFVDRTLKAFALLTL